MEGVNNGDNLQVFYLNETTGKWENIGGEYNAATGTVTATTDHFSTFAVFEAEVIDSDVIVPKVMEPSEKEEASDNSTEIINDGGSVTIDDSTPKNINADNASTDEDVGAVLPNTATGTYNLMFVGLALLLTGIAIFVLRRFSVKKA